MPGFLDSLRQLTERITPTPTPIPSATPLPTRTPRPSSSPVTSTKEGWGNIDPELAALLRQAVYPPQPRVTGEGWGNIDPELARMLEQGQMRKSLAELARHTLNNYDQLETLPLGDLFTKIPLGSGFYSRLLDSYIDNVDRLDASDHQRAVEAFGASGMSHELQDQIMQSLLKSFLSDQEDAQQQATMTGFTVPNEMRLPMPPQQGLSGSGLLGGAADALSAAGQWLMAPPAPPRQELGDVGAGIGAAVAPAVQWLTEPPPGERPSAAMSIPATSQLPTSSLRGTDLEGTAPTAAQQSQQQQSNTFRPTSLQLLPSENKTTGFIDLYSPVTHRKIGFYDLDKNAIYTGDSVQDLQDAKDSGVFPNEQLQKVTDNFSAVIDKAAKQSTDKIKIDAEAEANRAQAAYYSANAGKTATEARLLEIKATQDRQEFEVRMEALRLANELAPITKQAKVLEVSRAELDLQQAQQSYPLDLQYKQEQLAMAQAQRQQIEQEKARKSNMDTFAANFFPSLIAAISPGQQANATQQQLAQSAGQAPNDPMAQAAFALLQNNLRKNTGVQ